MKTVLEIQARNPEYGDYSFQKFYLRLMEQMVKDIDAHGMSEKAKDILLTSSNIHDITFRWQLFKSKNIWVG